MLAITGSRPAQLAAVCCLLAFAGGGAVARAGDIPPAPPAPLFSGTHLTSVAQASSLPYLGAYLSVEALTLGGGVNFNYESGGLLDTTGTATRDHVALGFHLYAAYVTRNTPELAMGPELTWAASLTPGHPLTYHAFYPGWTFWYAPFNAPLLLGVGFSLNVAFSGDDVSIGLATPGFRLAWVVF
jgi:hypothetical protein